MKPEPCSSAEPAARAGGRVRDLVQHRLERALRQRVRYRYVRPRVLREGRGFRIESPCCSRNVDPGGGTIDIAWLEPCETPAGAAADAAPGWRLCQRDHANGRWVACVEHASLDDLIDLLCLDPERKFWP